MFSDTFKMTLVDGFFYEVEGKVRAETSAIIVYSSTCSGIHWLNRKC